MVNGRRYVSDRRLLGALAAYFDVDENFLLDESDDRIPDRVTAQLDLVRAMRAARVKTFAARTLGDVSPDALAAITRFLDEDANGR